MATTDIRDLDPKDRRCLFQDEGDLRLYSDYTFTNCRSKPTLGPSSQVRVRSRETAREVQLRSMVSAQPGGTGESGGSLQQYYAFFISQGPNVSACDPWTEKSFTREINQAMVA